MGNEHCNLTLKVIVHLITTAFFDSNFVKNGISTVAKCDFSFQKEILNHADLL